MCFILVLLRLFLIIFRALSLFVQIMMGRVARNSIFVIGFFRTRAAVVASEMAMYSNSHVGRKIETILNDLH